MSEDSAVAAQIEQNLSAYRDRLFEFLRIPSISARPENAGDMRQAADWLADTLGDIGLNAVVHKTDGHPIVTGEWREAGTDAPTVLIYGHYDVQPVDPLELWTSPPFEPTIRDGRIYARGSIDDKGQLSVHINAIDSHLRANGKLPVNVVLIVEGEEEVGSDSLLPFVEQNTDLLRADAIVISDSSMVGPGKPTIGASLRGLAYFEVTVTGPKGDLHSGSYGGALINPATALIRMIASLHDDDWRVTLPGFYDAVHAAPEFRDQIRQLPFDEQEFKERTGVPAVGGEAGYTTLERLWVRPTLEVNGLLSGYTGEGAKTVLPAKAMAKISCRLVPDQDPDQVEKQLRAHIASVTPAGVNVDIKTLHGGKPWRAKLGGPLYDAAKRALESAFGNEITYAGEGGTIPIVPEFERILGAPVLLMGLGLPGENAHAPNEWMAVENFERGTYAAADLMSELAGQSVGVAEAG